MVQKAGEQDMQSARLEQLSLEVQRLSRTLEDMRLPAQTDGDELAARRRKSLSNSAKASKGLGGGWSASNERHSLFSNADGVLTAAAVRDLLRARRLRDQFFGGELFADPAWDMILDLMAARLSGERVSVSSLCIAAAVPPTTALRWIRHLTQAGMLERRPDTQDGRRVFIALSDEAAASVHRWYASSLAMRHEDED